MDTRKDVGGAPDRQPPQKTFLDQQLNHTTPLQAARAYAIAIRWAVFPVHSVCNGLCTCGDATCKNPGKHPYTLRGLKDASTNTEKIISWWTKRGDANIGVATGLSSGILALDIDADHGGETSLANLVALHGGELPHTVEQRTGRGRHLLFEHPKDAIRNSAGRLGPGLDVRADGGYIIVAPSLHSSGRRYAWVASRGPSEIALAPLPDWLLKLLIERQATYGNGNSIDGSIPQGQRNTYLASLAGSMRRRGLSVQAIEAALGVENAARCDPPLPEHEVQRIACSIGRYAPETGVKANGDERIELDGKLKSRLNAAAAWPEPLPEAAYHGLAGEIVRTIEPHTESDPAAILIQLLAAFGNCIGTSPHYQVEGSRHTANLFAVLVGRTSKARKGTSWERITQLFHLVADQWAEMCVQSGLSSGEGLIWAVRDPISRRKSTGKGTDAYMDEAGLDDGVSDKRLLVIEEEFAATLRVMGREGNTLSPVLRKAWDGHRLTTLTKNSPACATGAHISIIGHITVDELRRYLDRTECGNGFANRFLYLCVKRARCLPDGGNLSEDSLKALACRLAEEIECARTIERVTMNDEASIIWHAVYPELSEGLPGLLGAVTSRAEAQVLRLALLYALLDASDVIRPEHLKAALAIWEYAEDSACYIFGSALGDPVADEMYRALKAASDKLTRTEISNLLKRNKTAETIGRALETLARAKLARSIQQQTDGRPIEVWQAC
jgi:hypothetical protein